MLLAGDIGGTKTVLALFSAEAGPHEPLVKERFDSADYASLTDIVSEFVQRHQPALSAACFGVAGPVHHNRVQVTNLPWVVDGNQLSRILGDKPVYIINDLVAIASSVPLLEPDDRVLLKDGQVVGDTPIAILAPGTGLGEAFLFWDGQRYRPIPSEGGHKDFGPATPLELALLDHLRPRLGHVSYERVCSGIGIPNLYAFFRDTGRYSEPEWLAEELAAAEDPTPIIVRTAQEEKANICVATLDLFMAILGNEAGNMALQVLSAAGVYLGGGIPPRILTQLQKGTFQAAFVNKGRFSRFLDGVPVYVIMNGNVALYGAANHGFLMTGERT
jgi:glucokinase